MTDQELALLALFVTNFPFIISIGILFVRDVIVWGKEHRRIIDRMQKELDFREQLRQEAIQDKKAIEEKSAKQADALKELTNVVRQSLDFNERILEERANERTRTTGGSSRPRP